jgi:signal transduction histidine kinase
VEIVVSDTGCGLSPEEREHLFEKYRLARHKADGSGLGLYICKTLVEANQGRIWMDSAVGQGTSFHLAFPAADPPKRLPRGRGVRGAAPLKGGLLNW